jgi:hypothetical protein
MLGDQLVHLCECIPAMDHERLSVFDREMDLSNKRFLLEHGVGEVAVEVETRLPHSCNRWDHAGDAISLSVPAVCVVGVKTRGGFNPIWMNRGQLDRSLRAFGVDPGNYEPFHLVGPAEEVCGWATVKLQVTMRVYPHAFRPNHGFPSDRRA